MKIKSLKKGQRIKTKDNKTVELECLVETNVFNYVDMVRIDNLFITPYHPCFYEGRWRFPQELIGQPEVELVNMFVESYYNVVLTDKGKSILCEGIECISLAH